MTACTLSEFGRCYISNGSGTDHGWAGPVLVLGKRVRGGLYGHMPSLQDTEFGNLIPAVDLRDLYAALAEGWLNSPAGAAIATSPEREDTHRLRTMLRV